MAYKKVQAKRKLILLNLGSIFWFGTLAWKGEFLYYKITTQNHKCFAFVPYVG